MRKCLTSAAVLPLLLASVSANCRAQSGSFLGAQAVLSTLGPGGEVAVRILPRVNLRGGFAVLSFHHTFRHAGTDYAGTLFLRSAAARIDFYPAGPFHISPGVLLYNGFHESALAAIPGGATLTLGGVSYQSSTASPLSQRLDIRVRKTSPQITFGFGNLVPSRGHFTWNSDFGVVFAGPPRTTLAVAGLACLPPNTSGPACVDASTNPAVAAAVSAQREKINISLSVYRYYPLLSFGIGYRF